MTAGTILDRLRALGVTARADGETLRLRPASAVPPDLLAEAKARKVELLALIRSTQPALPPGAAEWLGARTLPLRGCCVGVGDAVASFLAHTPDGDPLALVRALAAGAVPGVRIAVTANSARLVVGLRITDCPVMNASGRP